MLTSDHGAHLIPVGSVARGPAEHAAAVVLVVHGGKERSTERGRAWNVAVLRLRPFASAIARKVRTPATAVFRVQLAIRGWNGSGSSPQADLYWALGHVQRHYPGRPVVLVGHSMGARTVLRLADETQVCGIVVLAPWVEESDPVSQLAGVRLTVIQGSMDRVTPVAYSERYFERAEAAGAILDNTVLTGTGHAMLSRAATWHRLTVEAVQSTLDAAVSNDRHH